MSKPNSVNFWCKSTTTFKTLEPNVFNQSRASKNAFCFSLSANAEVTELHMKMCILVCIKVCNLERSTCTYIKSDGIVAQSIIIDKLLRHL